MLLAELGANGSLAHSLLPRERHLSVEEYRRLHLPQFRTRSLQLNCPFAKLDKFPFDAAKTCTLVAAKLCLYSSATTTLLLQLHKTGGSFEVPKAVLLQQNTTDLPK